MLVGALSGHCQETPVFALENRLTGSNYELAVQIFQKLQKLKDMPENLLFSPTSVQVGLTEILGGAANRTAKQLEIVLGIEGKSEKIHQQAREWSEELLPSLKKSNDQTFIILNSLWVQNEIGILKTFSNFSQGYYRNELDKVDFEGSPDPTRLAINGTIEKKTDQKILNLIPSGVVNNSTRLLLTQANYFKSSWKTPFNKNNTREDQFQLRNSHKITVEFMMGLQQVPYLETPDFQVLYLSYKNKRFGLTFLLPTKDVTTPDLHLSGKQLKELFQQLLNPKQQKTVRIFLPRFKVEGVSRLGEALFSLGVKDAFMPSKADFSMISGQKNIYLSEVIQKSVLDLTEEGASEIPAKSVAVQGTAETKNLTEFKANRPFIYFLMDRLSGMILLMGRMEHPSL